MASQRKTLIWLLVIAVIAIVAAIIIYLFRCDIFKNLNSCVKDPNKSNTPTPPGSKTTKWIPEMPPYDLGMWGEKIKTLQTALGFPSGNCGTCADGKLGTNTKNSIIAKGYTFPLSQKDYDTIVGTLTSGSTSNPPPNPGPVIGNKVYAKNSIVNIRSTPDVNNGIWNNKLCDLPLNYEPAPTILEIKDCSKTGTGCVHINNYYWYKISFTIPNCSYKEGWVRQDVVNVQ